MPNMSTTFDQEKHVSSVTKDDDQSHMPDHEGILNVSGHVQELDRSFGVWSICALGVGGDNAWNAGAGALVLTLYNGGGPGVIYSLFVLTNFPFPHPFHLNNDLIRI